MVLNEDLPAERLVVGDVGTIVHVHAGGAAFEVEFMTFTGETVAITTVRPTQIRSLARDHVAHVRDRQFAPGPTLHK